MLQTTPYHICKEKELQWTLVNMKSYQQEFQFQCTYMYDGSIVIETCNVHIICTWAESMTDIHVLLLYNYYIHVHMWPEKAVELDPSCYISRSAMIQMHTLLTGIIYMYMYDMHM